MNETIYIVEVVRVCFVCCFFGKEEERMLKQKHNISVGLFGATSIYQNCLTNIHTEFLAND